MLKHVTSNQLPKKEFGLSRKCKMQIISFEELPKAVEYYKHHLLQKSKELMHVPQDEQEFRI